VLAAVVDGKRRPAKAAVTVDRPAYTLLVDAKDKAAAAFYRHHRFIARTDSPMTLFLPPAKVR
jgi:hypothetical protein